MVTNPSFQMKDQVKKNHMKNVGYIR